MKRMKTILNACAVAALLILSFAVALADSVTSTTPQIGQETPGETPGSESTGQTPAIPDGSDGQETPAEPDTDDSNGRTPRSGASDRSRGNKPGNNTSDRQSRGNMPGSNGSDSQHRSGNGSDSGMNDGGRTARRSGKSAKAAATLDTAKLVENGVLSQETADAIQAYLQEKESAAPAGEDSEASPSEQQEEAPSDPPDETSPGRAKHHGSGRLAALLDELLQREIITAAEREAILAAL